MVRREPAIRASARIPSYVEQFGSAQINPTTTTPIPGRNGMRSRKKKELRCTVIAAILIEKGKILESFPVRVKFRHNRWRETFLQ